MGDCGARVMSCGSAAVGGMHPAPRSPRHRHCVHAAAPKAQRKQPAAACCTSSSRVNGKVTSALNLRLTGRRLGTAFCTRASAQDAVATDDALRVDLPTKEAQRSIKFTLARVGRETAVLVDRLADGAAAAEAGVRPGQRLLSISDPMSAGLWQLNDRPSIRFVRDALAMRSADTITLVLSRESVYEAAGAGTGLASVYEEGGSGSAGAEAAGGAAAAEGSDGETAGYSSDGDSATVAEKLAQQYRDKQAEAAAQQTAFQRRQRRRKEFIERESARDDGAFFALTAAAFLLPAVGILAVAYFSGYLDRLSNTYGG